MDTTPQLRDSDNNLLQKICKILHDGLSPAATPTFSGAVFSSSVFIGDINSGGTFDYTFLTSGGMHVRRRTADNNPPVLEFDKRGKTGDESASAVSGTQLGQIIFDGWDGTVFAEGSTVIGGANEVWSGAAHGGNLQFYTTSPGTTTRVERVRLDNVALNLKNSTSLQVAGVQVVTDRQTGWTAATGVATRTTFATGSVSLSVLAEHVKALIDDLIAHGLIGT